jgi:restriction endonuclease S subunit
LGEGSQSNINGQNQKFCNSCPPLAVQEEIVKILDTFTTLEAELEAELEARKKQYAYYRDALLTPIEVNGKWLMNNEAVAWKTLGEVQNPHPPLAEQERIVAILDQFDALVNDIAVGLPAELNARRQQYEYYRSKLLSFEMGSG